MNIVPILHNLRSLHNVGSILRTCDGLGINEVWVSGHTPYPQLKKDERLPHVAKRATNQIAKTALGAQESVKVLHFEDIRTLSKLASRRGLELVAVEQAKGSVVLDAYEPTHDIGVIFGNEVNGLDPATLELCKQVVEIPMKGKKESFNVSVAAGIALYTISRHK